MKRTNNYNLIVVEGSDKVNLLTQMNPNTEKIDEVMKSNENTGVHNATELLSGTIHAITRTVTTASMFKFTAVSNYTAGDTFTVDGVQVTALLTSGEALGTGAYIIGSEVLCSLKDTLLTIYTQGGTVKTAEDSEKLGGNLPEYYAKQSELNNVKNTADSASSLSRQNSDSIISVKQDMTNINLYVGADEKLHFVNSVGADSVIPFSSGYKEVAIVFAVYQKVAACILIKPNKSIQYGWANLQGDYMYLTSSGNGNSSITARKSGKYLVFDTQSTSPKTSTTQKDIIVNQIIVNSPPTTEFSINIAVAL